MEPESVRQDLEKWSKKTREIEYKKKDGNSLFFVIGSAEFQMKIPSGYPDGSGSILLETASNDIILKKLMGLMNLYSENRKAGLYNILRRTEKKYQELKSETAAPVNISLADTIAVNNFDFELMNLEQKLKDMIGKSRSPIASNSSTIPKLYEKNSIGNILISQYIELMREYREDKRIDIHLIDENIFTWKLCFGGFKNKKLMESLAQMKEKFGNDTIDIEIDFHDSLYPAHPPVLKIIKPRIDSLIACKLANIRMVQLEYWNPTFSIKRLIEKVYSIVEKHVVLDPENTMNTDPERCSFQQLEVLLMKLSSFYKEESDEDNLDEEEYPKRNATRGKTNTNTNTNAEKYGDKNYWAKGTGYGHHGQSGWNVDEYLQIQKERDIQIETILTQVINQLQNDLDKGNEIALYETVAGSQLISFIKSNLNGTTILAMSERTSFYTTIISIIQNLGTNDGMFLFDSQKNSSDKKLIKILEDLYNEATTVKKYDSGADEADLSIHTGSTDITNMIITIYEWIYPCYAEFESMKQITQEKEDKERVEKDQEEKALTLSKERVYVDTLSKLIFADAAIKGNSYKYTPDASPLTKRARRKIATEFATMTSSFEVNPSSSIFYRVDKSDIRIGRVLITGPVDTPYQDGCLIFDLLLPSNYPDTYPQMNFKNHGGMRFNPNLYDTGKVCLSLLGTWHTDAGQGGESWNKDISTLSQLFKSIQSLILVDHPYFNEPSYERNIGTSDGDKYSAQYNHNIRYYNMCYTIRDTLSGRKNWHGFEDIIFEHFKMKQDDIIAMCEKWTNDADENINKKKITKSPTLESYKKVTNEIRDLFKKTYA